MSIREKIDGNFLYFFDQGQALEAYKVFGAHLQKDEKGKNIACEFCLYAPNASRVELVGEWNDFINWFWNDIGDFSDFDDIIAKIDIASPSRDLINIAIVPICSNLELVLIELEIFFNFELCMQFII